MVIQSLRYSTYIPAKIPPLNHGSKKTGTLIPRRESMSVPILPEEHKSRDSRSSALSYRNQEDDNIYEELKNFKMPIYETLPPPYSGRDKKNSIASLRSQNMSMSFDSDFDNGSFDTQSGRLGTNDTPRSSFRSNRSFAQYAQTISKSNAGSANSKNERVVYLDEKKETLLPHFCVYFAWLLVVLSILASAFFTILYSFQWGRVKSTAWLVAFVLCFFQSIIIIQPAKVSNKLKIFNNLCTNRRYM